MEKPNFKQMCLMHIQQLTNFPYIEKDFDALTDYQLLCKVVAYLNKIITNENQQNETITALYDAFVAIKDYVENYFDNLDVQEEINNKLDKMAEDGTLDQIIEQYLNSSAIWGFDNVASMKNATNLINGSFAHTLGYYNKNDGGKALYKIRQITNDDVVDEMFIIALNDDNLIAELIIDKTYNVNQVGIIGDNLTNNGTKINNLFTKIPSRSKVYFPNGTYLTNIAIDCDNDIDLLFESSNAIIKAISEIDTLFIYNKSRHNSHYNRGQIINGTFDGNDLVNVGFEMNNAAAFELNHISINNCKQIGFKGSGSSTLVPANGGFRIYDMNIRNWNHAYANSIAFYCNCSDSCFDNCVAINFETAFYNTISNTFIKCHPWISMPDLYEKSVAFKHSGRYSLYVDCIVDTIRTAFKNTANTVINAMNIECYDGPSIIGQEIVTEYPFIFHDGNESNAIINATSCRCYSTYGANVVATLFHSNSKFYNCSFRTSQNGSFDFSNYIDNSSVTDELASRSYLNNIDFNNFYQKTKTYYVGINTTSSNNPSSNAGFLEVKRATLENANITKVIQTYTEYTSGKKYERRYDGNTWTQWLQL